MDGFRFYLEHKSNAAKRKGEHEGNVVALIPENRLSGTSTCEAIVGVYSLQDTPVAGASVTTHYLRTRCKRIAEVKARLIHPSLFNYLDAMACNQEAR